MSHEKRLTGDEAARLIHVLHDLEVPERAKVLAAEDAMRVNSGVRSLADVHFDFFDAPAHLARAQRELKR